MSSKSTVTDQPSTDAMPDWQDFRRPVNVTFLMNVFAMERRTVQAKLLNLAPMGYERGNAPLYDFRQAAAYLVKPIGDLKEQLKSFRVQDLPDHLREPYWAAMLKRQQYLKVAGDLWPTEAVLDVFGDVFLTIKSRMQLWPETLAENTDLSDDQRARLVQMVDDLQDDIHARLLEIPARRQTKNLAAQLEDDGAPSTSDIHDEEDIVG